MQEVSLVSWVFHEECYIELFVMYHLALGFSKIFLLVDFKDDIDNYTFINKYPRVVLIKNIYNGTNWDNNNCRMTFDILKQMDTEWVMLLGMDQFFVCKEFDIVKLVNAVDADVTQIQFPMYVLWNHSNLVLSFENLRDFTGLPLNWLNTCCRIKDIKGISSHIFQTNDKANILRGDRKQTLRSWRRKPCTTDQKLDTEYYLKFPFSLHIYTRNYYDLMVKHDDPRYKNSIKEVTAARMTVGAKMDEKIHDMIRIGLSKTGPEIFTWKYPNEAIEEWIVSKKVITKEQLKEYHEQITEFVKEKS